MFGQLERYGCKLDPKDYHFSVSRRISRLEYDRRRNETDHFMRSSLRDQLARFLSQERVDIREDDEWSVEYRADLYVFNPDQFWGIIDGMSADYARQFAPPMPAPRPFICGMDHPRYTEWQEEVTAGNTVLGLSDWVEHNPIEEGDDVS